MDLAALKVKYPQLDILSVTNLFGSGEAGQVLIAVKGNTDTFHKGIVLEMGKNSEARCVAYVAKEDGTKMNENPELEKSVTVGGTTFTVEATRRLPLSAFDGLASVPLVPPDVLVVAGEIEKAWQAQIGGDIQEIRPTRPPGDGSSRGRG